MSELGPLPEAAHHSNGPFGLSVVPLYTAEQMRSYAQQEVEKERERCAKLCDVSASIHGGAWDEHADPSDQGAAIEAERLAEAIRGHNAGDKGPRSGPA